MTSRGPSSEQLAWRLSGGTSWRWEPGARQVGQVWGKDEGRALCGERSGGDEPSWDGGVAVCVCACARVCVSAPTLYMCRYTCVHVHICVCNWLICVYVYAHVYA